jgi:hypothetical protein
MENLGGQVISNQPFLFSLLSVAATLANGVLRAAERCWHFQNDMRFHDKRVQVIPFTPARSVWLFHASICTKSLMVGYRLLLAGVLRRISDRSVDADSTNRSSLTSLSTVGLHRAHFHETQRNYVTRTVPNFIQIGHEVWTVRAEIHSHPYVKHGYHWADFINLKVVWYVFVNNLNRIL